MTRHDKRLLRAQRHNMGTPRISAAAETMCVAADRYYGSDVGVIHVVDTTKVNQRYRDNNAIATHKAIFGGIK